MAAVPWSLTQRLAKQPNPQSGFRASCDGRNQRRAASTRATIPAGVSTSAVRGLTTPRPNSRSANPSPTTAMSPARGVAYSSTNWRTFIAVKAGSSRA